MMSMKSLPHNHPKHQCTRENCLGHANDYNNYLLALNKTKPKNKFSKTARSMNSLHQKLIKDKKKKASPKQKSSKHEISQKSEVEQQKRRIQELNQQLLEKSRRITDLKLKLKDYEARIKQYQAKIAHYQKIINENDHPKSPITLEKPSQNMIIHYQQQLKLLQTSQKATMDAMQKYRLLQKEYHEYRSQNEKKMDKILRQNEQMRMFGVQQKDYDQQISSLKKQLHKLSQIQQSPIIHHKNPLQNEYIVLKTHNKQLMIEKENLKYQLQEKDEREKQLRGNLENINRKVEKWGDQYQKMIEERRLTQERYEQLQLKLEQKREKHMKEKQDWANIFRDLMKQVDKLKKQITRYEKSKSMRTNNYYSQQNQQ